MSHFSDLFTLAYPIVEDGEAYFMEHTDGAVSCAVKWAGIDYEATHDEHALAQSIKSLYSLYVAASAYTNLFIENHLFRGLDNSHAETYYEYGVKNFREDRNPQFSRRIRREMADHLGKFARHNDVYMVFVLQPRLGIFGGRGTKAVLQRKQQLASIVNELCGFLPDDAELLDIDRYHSLILRHNNPARVENGRDITPYNYRFEATNSIIAPTIERRCIRTQGKNSEGYYHRVIALLDYPDALMGWCARLSRDNSDTIHIVQTTNALDTQLVNLKSARESERSFQAASLVGGESVAGKLRDAANFRDFVQQHNLTIHANNYVIIISDVSIDVVNQRHSEICRWLRENPETLIVTDDPEMELNYFRTSTPSMGYKSPYFREDHHWQVCNMLPCFAQKHGDMTHPEMAFLTSVGTTVGIRQKRGALHHSLAAAKTGSGKSVTMAAMIAQLYPLGFNFYITEVGRSYEFLVRAFGGEYHVLDPDKTVVSPFSSYEEMRKIAASNVDEDKDDADENEEIIFSATAISTMRNCLLPILLATSSVEDYPNLVHCQSVLDDLIRILYSMPDPELSCPTLKTALENGRAYHEHLKDCNDHRAEFLGIMLNNLDSFLKTAEGSVFANADTLEFKSGLIGLDFGQLIHGQATNLAKYLLLFTSTRLQQLSFIQPEQSFLVFDEDHEYTAIDKKLMNLLKSQVTKRGRKHGAFLYPISQSVKDIAYSDDGTVNTDVINQMSNFLLLYYGTDHGNLPELFKLPERAAKIWKNYPDPLAAGAEFNYRQGLFVQSGNFYDVFFTWPEILSAITNSNPDAIAFKDQLLKEEKGDMVRILDRFMKEYSE